MAVKLCIAVMINIMMMMMMILFSNFLRCHSTITMNIIDESAATNSQNVRRNVRRLSHTIGCSEYDEWVTFMHLRLLMVSVSDATMRLLQERGCHEAWSATSNTVHHHQQPAKDIHQKWALIHSLDGGCVALTATRPSHGLCRCDLVSPAFVSCSVTICRPTSDDRTCHTTVSNSRRRRFYLGHSGTKAQCKTPLPLLAF